MKEPDLTLRGRSSISRSLSPVSNRDSQILSPSAAKARGIRESKRFSWEGYENLLAKNEEGYKSSSPPPDSPLRRASRFKSLSPSPSRSCSPARDSTSRGPSPESPNQEGASPPPDNLGEAALDARPATTTKRLSKQQSLQFASPVEINGRFSAPPDLYSFPRSKSQTRFTRSLPKLPDDIPSIQRSGSPTDFHDIAPVGPVGTSPARGFGYGHGRPTFVSHQPERGRDGERRSFFGDNYGYRDTPQIQEAAQPLKVTSPNAKISKMRSLDADSHFDLWKLETHITATDHLVSTEIFRKV
jgi:hypothetical protein